MKKNIKIIITKNNNDNINDNSKIINSYVDNINDDINKNDEKVIYNLQYFINILHYLIKKYIILILLILIIITVESRFNIHKNDNFIY